MAKTKKENIKPEISMEKVVDYLRCSGGFAPAVSEVARRQLTAAAAGQKGLKVSDGELQVASDAWRAFNGLLTAEDTKNWLKNAGLSMDSYEDYLETNLLISKFKEALAADAKIDKIFADPQNRDAAVELLYADWLARSVK
jgi:hypothetical protein